MTQSEQDWTSRPLFTDSTEWTEADIARELDVALATVRRWARSGMYARAAGRSDDNQMMLPRPLPPAPVQTQWLTAKTWLVQADRPRVGDRYVVAGQTYELVDRAELVGGSSSRWLAQVRLVEQADGLPGQIGHVRGIELVCPLAAPPSPSPPRWAAGEVRRWAVRCGRIDMEGRPIRARPPQPQRWNGGAILGWGAGRPAPQPPNSPPRG